MLIYNFLKNFVDILRTGVCIVFEPGVFINYYIITPFKRIDIVKCVLKAFRSDRFREYTSFMTCSNKTIKITAEIFAFSFNDNSLVRTAF